MTDSALMKKSRWDSENILLLLISLLLLFIIIAAPLSSKKYQALKAWLARFGTILEKILQEIEISDSELSKAIEHAGYRYDSKQGIFYSHLNAWQRNFGYCRLYDEAAAPFHMIIDCEPVYFEYAGKRWMIELWKGQYALTTGCEVGIYNTTRPDITIPGIFSGPFFDCASDEELLHISYSLKKENTVLFTREGKHWWLTGFILGEFSEPEDLSMDVSIIMKDQLMLEAFVNGLLQAGYEEEEIDITDRTVSLHFDKPRTEQPFTRTPATDWLIQRKNEFLCKMLREITVGFDSLEDKMQAAAKRNPEMANLLQNMGRHSQLYQQFDLIIQHLK